MAVIRAGLLLCGAVLVLAGCTAAAETTTSAESFLPLVSTTTMPEASTSTSSTTPAAEGWFVVSITAELPESFASDLKSIEGVDAASIVRVENVELVESRDAGGAVVDRTPEGFYIPLETHVIDAGTHADYVPEPMVALLAALEPDEVVLSESSAAFRNLGAGSELLLQDGSTLVVAGVVADEWVGAAELAVSPAGGAALGVERERYALVHYDGTRSELEMEVAELADAPVRIRGREEVDVFRHADAVASQIAIKTMFGEFALRPTQGDFIEIDPAWLEANIIELEMPLLGNDKCHRKFVAILTDAMRQLERAGQADAIDSSAYLGCWNSRFIRGRSDLSRHAWGAAADINFGNESDGGPGSPTHPGLVAAMLERDVLSGHLWTDPGPGHFEWFGP